VRVGRCQPGELHAWDWQGAGEKLGHPGQVNVAAAHNDNHAITLRHRNASKEEGGERGGAGRLNYLLAALGEESKAAEDLFIGEGDAGIQQ
jgi:hypothetical protein